MTSGRAGELHTPPAERDALQFRGLRLRRGRGERHVSANGAAERDASGQVITLFGVIMDVTESRARELALRDSEQRYRMLTERATDVIIRYDTVGVIEFASPSVRQFGYAPDDLVGRNIAELVHADDLTLALSARDTIVQGGVLNRNSIMSTARPSGWPVGVAAGQPRGDHRRGWQGDRRGHGPARRHRSQGDGGGASSQTHGGGSRRGGQGRVPGQYEPRNPHAAHRIIGFSGLMAQMDGCRTSLKVMCIALSPAVGPCSPW